MSFSESWLTGPNDTPFYTRVYRPPEGTNVCATLVFVHGYNEHCGRYEIAHKYWASKGFIVFTYDLRGHGRTALDETNRAPNSVYGGFGDCMSDLEWALSYAQSLSRDNPLFLMGHSMGGGICQGYFTREDRPPSKDTIAALSGVISSSPWLLLSNPLPQELLDALEEGSKATPDKPFPTPIQVTNLSRDLSVGESQLNDPWIRPNGTVAGLWYMWKMGVDTHAEGYKRWPRELPLLLLHGTADNMNSCKATEDFHDKVDSDGKKLILYPDAYHDLMSEPIVKESYLDDCFAWVRSRLPPQ